MAGWSFHTFHVAGCPLQEQGACQAGLRATCCRVTCNRWGRAVQWSVRHVQRRVQLTLRLGRREPGARLGTAAPDDVPAAILTLQRLRGERDHLTYRGTGEDHVHPAGPGAKLQLGEQRMAVAGTRGSEGR